jgi:hypothetical protein
MWNRLWQDGPDYVLVFVSILRDIFKEETVEYVLALIDEMLTCNWKIFCLLIMYILKEVNLLFIFFDSKPKESKIVP